jgi:Protein of unknown function (DUF3224)
MASVQSDATPPAGSSEPAIYDQPGEGPALSSIHVEEEFSGDIEGTGVVEFLQAQVSDAAASFVGIERVLVRRARLRHRRAGGVARRRELHRRAQPRG